MADPPRLVLLFQLVSQAHITRPPPDQKSNSGQQTLTKAAVLIPSFHAVSPSFTHFPPYLPISRTYFHPVHLRPLKRPLVLTFIKYYYSCIVWYLPSRRLGKANGALQSRRGSLPKQTAIPHRETGICEM